MAGGDFSQEAYQALREAYANEMVTQEEAEVQGVQVMGLNLSTETIPVDSPWLDKVDLEQYPSGKSAYSDEPQRTPEEVLEIMRASVAKRDAEEADEIEETEEESMSDEEVDNLIESILDDEDDDSEETDEEEGEEEEDEDEGEDEDEDEDDDDEEEDEDGEEDEETEEETDDSDEVDEMSPDDIASEIEALRAELDAMTFRPEEQSNDE